MFKDIENKIKGLDVITEPFPHIVIDEILDPKIAIELVEKYPSQNLDSKRDNQRWNISSNVIQDDVNIDKVWKKLLSEIHCTSFVDVLINKFKPYVNKKYNNEFDRHLRLNSKNLISLGRKKKEDNNYFEIQVSGNTQVIKKKIVRGIHVDSGKKLLSGLLYLGNQDLMFYQGGNLELYKWKFRFPSFFKEILYKEPLSKKLCTRLKTIETKHNRAVFFVNSIDSLHAVSERSYTARERYFLNFINNSDKYIFFAGRDEFFSKFKKK